MASLGVATMTTRLDLMGLTTGFRAAEKEADKSAQTIGQKITALGPQFTRVGRTMSLAVTAPLVAMGAGVIKLSGDFEKSMNRVQALSGATGESLERLSGQARQLGADTQFSASEAADAMSFLAMAGFNVDQIYASMPDTLNLAAAAQLDMGSSADIVSNIMTGFGLATSDLGGAVDVLTKAFISSNTDLTMLGQGMKFVGPIASGLGVSFEETTAALGLLSNAGIQAGSAGTGLRRILGTLASEADKLGIATTDSTGALRPLADLLDELNKRGLTTAEALEIFGDRGGPAMQALLSQGGQALRDFTGELENAGGTAARVAETQMAGLHGMIKELQSAGEELALSLGDAGLLDFMKNATVGLTNLIRRFNELPKPVKSAALVIGGVATAAGPVLIVLGSILRALPLVAGAFGTLRLAMLPFLGPTGLILAGVGGIIALSTALSDPGGRGLEQSLEDAEAAVGDFESALEEAKGDMSDTRVIETLNDSFTSLGENLTGPVKRAFEGMRTELLLTVQEAENANTALTRIIIGGNLAQDLNQGGIWNARLSSGFRQAGATMFGDSRIVDADIQIQSALLRGDLEEALRIAREVEAVLARAPQSGVIEGISEYTAHLETVIGRLEQPVTTTITPNVVVPDPIDTGDDYDALGLPKDGTTREIEVVVTVRNAETADSLFAALASEGTAVNRTVNRLGATPELVLEGMQRKAELFDAAMRRAWEIPDMTADRFDYLVQRGEELKESAEAFEHAMSVSVMTGPDGTPLGTGGPAGTQSDPVVVSFSSAGYGPPPAVMRGAVAGEAGRIAADTEAAQRAARLAGYDEQLAVNAENQRQRNVIAADTQEALAIATERATTAMLSVPGAVTATVPDARDLVPPEVEAVVPAAVSLVESVEGITAGLGDLAEGSVNQLRGRISTLQSMADNAADPAVRAGLVALVQRLEEELADLIHRSTPRALAITPTSNVLQPRALLDPGVTVTIDGMDPAEWQRRQDDAADRFAATVVSAGFAMGDAAIQAIEDGDIPGLLQAGLSGAGSILGGSNLGSIGFLGGSIGVGSLVAGGLGLLGTLIGAIFSGGRSDADRAAEQQRRVGNVPAININFTVEQTNHYQGGPSQPENEQAFRRQADALFESLYRRHLGPRLDRIESRLGIAGVA